MAPAQENRALVSAIGQIALTVTNLPRAVEFYRDTLGLKFLFDAANMAFFDCNGVRLMLTISEPKISSGLRSNSGLAARFSNRLRA
jgi:catechol 2,3-dioxygenase-like lactoylglutathione lyase family enzyme